MPDAAKIIKDWCASCGMPEPSDGECHALAVAISAAAPVVLPEPVSDEQIKAVFLANGFTIKEGLTDLKPYVYQAARALLATCGQAQELANTVQTVFDALQDKIDARGPISKGNLQYYVNLLREAFDAAPQAQAVAHSVAKTEPVWIAARNLNSIRADYQRETGDTHPGNDYWAGRFVAGYVRLMDAVIDLQLKEPATQQADARDADDADLIEWLSGQYLAADFKWGDPKTPVLVIEIPATASVCGDFRTDVRAAIAIAAAKGQHDQ